MKDYNPPNFPEAVIDNTLYSNLTALCISNRIFDQKDYNFLKSLDKLQILRLENEISSKEHTRQNLYSVLPSLRCLTSLDMIGMSLLVHQNMIDAVGQMHQLRQLSFLRASLYSDATLHPLTNLRNLELLLLPEGTTPGMCSFLPILRLTPLTLASSHVEISLRLDLFENGRWNVLFC